LFQQLKRLRHLSIQEFSFSRNIFPVLSQLIYMIMSHVRHQGW